MKFVVKIGHYEKDGQPRECKNLILRDENFGDIALKCVFAGDNRILNRVLEKNPEMIVKE